MRVVQEDVTFKTLRRVPKTGLMLVGWGGNNGTTITAGLLANKLNISWNTKEGVQTPKFYGSLTQCSTLRLGLNASGESVYAPFPAVLPMLAPNDIVLGGWDISSMNMADAMRRAQVLDFDLQQKLAPHMEHMTPLPAPYYSDFIALNQSDRADNVLSGSKQEHLDKIRNDIRSFKEDNGLDKVIVLWTANTERCCDVIAGVNDTEHNLLAAIKVCARRCAVLICWCVEWFRCCCAVCCLRRCIHPGRLRIHQRITPKYFPAGT